jgi:hypothetical protein
MKDSPESLDRLSTRVDELEKRVHALEHADDAKAALDLSVAQRKRVAAANASPIESGNLFPTLGRALLGIAGAYVLRAIAEESVVPKIIVAAIAIFYAFAWLIWASRSKTSALVQLVYAGTSALILVPMLWEVTLEFQVFAPSIAAAVLAVFALLGPVLDRRSDGSRISWVTHCAVAISAIALGVATHHVLPFVYVLLISGVLSEYAKERKGSRGLAALVALAADAAIWGMLYIYSGPLNARTEYPELSAASLVLPACLLFAMNASAVAVQSIFREERISVFDIAQTLIAFLVAISSVFLFAPAGARVILGVGCLVFAVVVYWVSFHRLRRFSDTRNFRIFGTWSAALLLMGVLWSFPQSAASILLAVAAPIAYWFGRRSDSRMLELHGALFLSSATVVSAMQVYVFGALAGSLPTRPSLTSGLIAMCAVLAYAIAKTTDADAWQKKALRFVPALVGACALTALFAHGLLTAATLIVPADAHHVAFLRTLSISLVSLGLAFAGSHWGRAAMTQMAYLALIFVAAKLLFEDLRHGHMEFIAGSIFLFAVTLIAVPRLVRLGATRRAAHSEIPVETKS